MTLDRRHRALYALLDRYCSREGQSNGHSPVQSAALGLSEEAALRLLVNQGFLQTVGPDGQSALQPTEKGLKAARRYRRLIQDERRQVRTALDRLYAAGDLEAAARLIAEYEAQQPRATALWAGAGAPPPEALAAARTILTGGGAVLDECNVSPAERQVLTFQAAEIALAGTPIVDRLVEIKRALHPEGNAWLVQQLVAQGQAQAAVSTEVATANTPADRAEAGRASQLPAVRMPIRLKITLPYGLLAVIFAVVGAYLVAQIVIENVQQRFTNQLIEAGRMSADRMVLEEQQRLATLRLLANMSGLPEALAAGDSETLRTLVLPVAINNQERAVELLDPLGRSVLSLRHTGGVSLEDYAVTRGEDAFRDWNFVQRVMLRQMDAGRDKTAGIAPAPWGTYFYVAGPVLNASGEMVGMILVGAPLDWLVRSFREDTLAHTTIYAMTGEPLATTLLAVPEEATLSEEQIGLVLGLQEDDSIIRDLTAGSVSYGEILGPWQARDQEDLGILGVALPQNYIIQTRQITQVQVALGLLLGIITVIGMGLLVSRRITRPLLEVVEASTKVAEGNLAVQVDPVGQDEVTVLAHSFNQMVVGLQEATQRRMREIELLSELEKERELRALKSEFVSMVSHEFRTPLTTILSSSDFLKEYSGAISEEKRRKHFDRIRSSVRLMTQLMEEVLVIGKSESGRLEYNPEPADFETFCREIVDELQATCEQTHTLKFVVTGSCDDVAIDPKLMRLAVSNLLSNAIKYSPDGGEVLFQVFCDGTSYGFSVKDSGVGIPAEDQPHLFEAFQRASNVRHIGGTGLGLYVTKLAVELHQGKITFESQEGHGTEFTVTIPRLGKPA